MHAIGCFLRRKAARLAHMNEHVPKTFWDWDTFLYVTLQSVQPGVSDSDSESSLVTVTADAGQSRAAGPTVTRDRSGGRTTQLTPATAGHARARPRDPHKISLQTVEPQAAASGCRGPAAEPLVELSLALCHGQPLMIMAYHACSSLRP